jgi:hypothetical protein
MIFLRWVAWLFVSLPPFVIGDNDAVEVDFIETLDSSAYNVKKLFTKTEYRRIVPSGVQLRTTTRTLWIIDLPKSSLPLKMAASFSFFTPPKQVGRPFD